MVRQRRSIGVRLVAVAALVVALVVYVTVSGRDPASPAPASQAPASPTPAVQTRVEPPTPVYGYDVVRAYPHDAAAFTQGLLFRDGFLFESTGLEGESTLRQVELETGKIVKRHNLDRTIFGEGLTALNDTLVQITWRNQIGFVYDLRTFAVRSTFAYAGQGWGLTHGGGRLILSDGEAVLRFFDATTFRETGSVPVTERGLPVENLNELEFVKGEVYANVWHENRIAVIDPMSGRVTAWVDLTGLRPESTRQDAEHVLNGIAYDAERDRMFVTGKRWPSVFEIRVRTQGVRP